METERGIPVGDMGIYAVT